MDARFGYYGNPAAAKFTKYLIAAGKVVSDSALPAATQQLVEIRASQINGCAVCTDMHTKDAAHAGEASVRLNLVATWREATIFTEAERAALELGERGQALRRRPARRAGVPHRPHQHLEPHERHHPAARRRLPARPVRVSRNPTAGLRSARRLVELDPPCISAPAARAAGRRPRS